MIRRVAAAMLSTVVALMGATGLDDGCVVDDKDVEIIDYGEDGASDPSRARLLALACQINRVPVDHVWVARHPQGASAAVTVQHEQPEIAHVSLAIGSDDGLNETLPHWLLTRALRYCRQTGALKVTIEPDAVPAKVITTIAEKSGFQFFRMNAREQVMEFYTNLYWKEPSRC